MRLTALILQAMVLLVSLRALSVEHDLLGTLEKKQSVISGVLNPGSLSFNGQEIYNGKENYQGLLLNSIPVPIVAVSGLKTFYTSTDSANLELEWLDDDGNKKPILKVQYPALTEFKTDADRLYFKFNEQVSEARLDSKVVNLQEASLDIDNFKEWVNEAHTLELISKKNTSQIYNLDFRKQRSELLTSRSLSFSQGRGPYSANVHPTSYGLNARLLNEYNVSFDVGVYLSKVSYEMGYGSFANPVTQRTGQLMGRYGYNPFFTNAGGFSLKRVTVGVQSEIINYARESLYVTSFDGQNTDKAEFWWLQGGPFIRWEPLQYRDWGFFINMDFRIYRTYTDMSSDGDAFSFGISYYF